MAWGWLRFFVIVCLQLGPPMDRDVAICQRNITLWKQNVAAGVTYGVGALVGGSFTG